MQTPFKCPYCGSTTYRILKQQRTIECQGCGRSHAFNEGFGEERPSPNLVKPATRPE